MYAFEHRMWCEYLIARMQLERQPNKKGQKYKRTLLRLWLQYKYESKYRVWNQFRLSWWCVWFVALYICLKERLAANVVKLKANRERNDSRSQCQTSNGIDVAEEAGQIDVCRRYTWNVTQFCAVTYKGDPKHFMAHEPMWMCSSA